MYHQVHKESNPYFEKIVGTWATPSNSSAPFPVSITFRPNGTVQFMKQEGVWNIITQREQQQASENTQQKFLLQIQINSDDQFSSSRYSFDLTQQSLSLHGDDLDQPLVLDRESEGKSKSTTVASETTLNLNNNSSFNNRLVTPKANSNPARQPHAFNYGINSALPAQQENEGEAKQLQYNNAASVAPSITPAANGATSLSPITSNNHDATAQNTTASTAPVVQQQTSQNFISISVSSGSSNSSDSGADSNGSSAGSSPVSPSKNSPSSPPSIAATLQLQAPQQLQQAQHIFLNNNNLSVRSASPLILPPIQTLQDHIEQHNARASSTSPQQNHQLQQTQLTPLQQQQQHHHYHHHHHHHHHQTSIGQKSNNGASTANVPGKAISSAGTSQPAPSPSAASSSTQINVQLQPNSQKMISAGHQKHLHTPKHAPYPTPSSASKNNNTNNNQSYQQPIPQQQAIPQQQPRPASVPHVQQHSQQQSPFLFNNNQQPHYQQNYQPQPQMYNNARPAMPTPQQRASVSQILPAQDQPQQPSPQPQQQHTTYTKSQWGVSFTTPVGYTVFEKNGIVILATQTDAAFIILRLLRRTSLETLYQLYSSGIHEDGLKLLPATIAEPINNTTIAGELSGCTNDGLSMNARFVGASTPSGDSLIIVGITPPDKYASMIQRVDFLLNSITFFKPVVANSLNSLFGVYFSSTSGSSSSSSGNGNGHSQPQQRETLVLNNQGRFKWSKLNTNLQDFIGSWESQGDEYSGTLILKQDSNNNHIRIPYTCETSNIFMFDNVKYVKVNP